MPSGFFAHYDIPDMTEAGTGSEQPLHLCVCVRRRGITHKSCQGFIDLQLGVLTYIYKEDSLIDRPTTHRIHFIKGDRPFKSLHNKSGGIRMFR